MPYIDDTDVEVQQERYRAFYAVPELAELMPTVPFYATWDDHDFGRNDTNGLVPGKRGAKTAFDRYHANPSSGVDGEGIFTSFRTGPVEVFLLDTRWFARTEPSEFDPEQPTLLGAAQWAWLRAGLKVSTAPFKILACGMIWNDAVRPGKTDHWGAYPAEFEGLCRFLGDEGITGVVLIGGDIHRSRVVVHATKAVVGYDLTELISSPMHGRVIDAANAPHPGLRFDSGEGHVVCIVAAHERELRATFQTPERVLHTEVIERSSLARPR
jgi:alkaline phosphatase D